MKICVIIMKKWYDNQRNYYFKIMISLTITYSNC